MEWYKGKTGLPVRRQISREICRRTSVAVEVSPLKSMPVPALRWVDIVASQPVRWSAMDEAQSYDLLVPSRHTKQAMPSPGVTLSSLSLMHIEKGKFSCPPKIFLWKPFNPRKKFPLAISKLSR
jgi:hypothetical protein